MSAGFSRHLEKIERIDEAEKQEIKKILGEKRMNEAKEDLERLVKVNEEVICLLEDLNNGGRPLNMFRPLKNLRERQEKCLEILKSEINLMVKNNDLSEDNNAFHKVEVMEQTIEGLEDDLIEDVKSKQPVALFRKEDLDRFVKKAKEAVLEDRNDRRDVKRGYETGGVFRVTREGSNYYFDTFIHADSSSPSPHNYNPEKEVEEVMKKVADERGEDNNFVVAHSHPPRAGGGSVFDHSEDDITYIRGEDFLNLKGISSKMGVLAVRESEGRESGIWVAVEMFLDDRFFIPVKIKGMRSEKFRKEYPRIDKYNQLLAKARIEGEKWFEYLD